MTTEAFHDEILAWVRTLKGKPYVLGVNGPQGAGKTTLTSALCRRLAEEGKRAVTISVDDFYLARAGQLALARQHPANPFLQQRGYPGTHDVSLGTSVLGGLRAGRPVKVPRYDKSAFQGQGDRLPEERWLALDPPVDLVFFEGWMLGFAPVSDPPPALREINALLASYAAWDALLDGFLQLDPLDHRYVLDWRVEAERAMRASGKAGMSDEEIRAYVEKFLPAYETYLPGLRAHPPKPGRRIVIGKDRLPR
jgi:D-glycerate 3-kinase